MNFAKRVAPSLRWIALRGIATILGTLFYSMIDRLHHELTLAALHDALTLTDPSISLPAFRTLRTVPLRHGSA